MCSLRLCPLRALDSAAPYVPLTPSPGLLLCCAYQVPEQVKKRFAAAAAMLNEQEDPAELEQRDSFSMSEEDKNADQYSKLPSEQGGGREEDDRLSGDRGGAEDARAAGKK